MNIYPFSRQYPLAATENLRNCFNMSCLQYDAQDLGEKISFSLFFHLNSLPTITPKTNFILFLPYS
jgi:hypothetical protein